MRKNETHWEKMSRISKEARELTKNCREHKCPYLKRFAGTAVYTDKYSQLYCGYCDITGHARLKEPENIDPNKCSHWKDKIEDTKTILIHNEF